MDGVLDLVFVIGIVTLSCYALTSKSGKRIHHGHVICVGSAGVLCGTIAIVTTVSAEVVQGFVGGTLFLVVMGGIMGFCIHDDCDSDSNSIVLALLIFIYSAGLMCGTIAIATTASFALSRKFCFCGLVFTLSSCVVVAILEKRSSLPDRSRDNRPLQRFSATRNIFRYEEPQRKPQAELGHREACYEEPRRTPAYPSSSPLQQPHEQKNNHWRQAGPFLSICCMDLIPLKECREKCRVCRCGSLFLDCDGHDFHWFGRRPCDDSTDRICERLGDGRCDGRDCEFLHLQQVDCDCLINSLWVCRSNCDESILHILHIVSQLRRSCAHFLLCRIGRDQKKSQTTAGS